MKIKNILVSQPTPTGPNSPYFDIAKNHGVKVSFHQFIRSEALTPKEFRAQHLNILDYTAIIFNSKNCIDFFFSLCKEMRVAIPEEMHYYCISENVANYLSRYIEYRKRRIFFSEHNNMEELIPAMLRRPKDKFLMAMPEGYKTDVIDMFAAKKIIVKPVVFYRTVTNPFTDETRADYDMYVLFTTSGVKGFLESYPQFEQGERVIACFGEKTKAALEAAGLRADIVAPSPSCPSITMAIDKYLDEHK